MTHETTAAPQPSLNDQCAELSDKAHQLDMLFRTISNAPNNTEPNDRNIQSWSIDDEFNLFIGVTRKRTMSRFSKAAVLEELRSAADWLNSAADLVEEEIAE